MSRLVQKCAIVVVTITLAINTVNILLGLNCAFNEPRGNPILKAPF